VKTCILVLVVAFAGIARADSYTAVTVEARDLDFTLRQLAESYEEPAGLIVRVAVPELGLKPGDVVRRINGQPAVGIYHATTAAVTYLDVQRGKQALVIRLARKASTERHMDPLVFSENVDHMRASRMIQLTKNNKASGVALGDVYWADLGDEGDVIRAVDGTPTNTIAAVLSALDSAKGHAKVELKMERADQPFTLTLVLASPPQVLPSPPGDPTDDEDAVAAALERIKKTSDTSYEIPQDVIDIVLNSPTALMRSARVVPAVKDGQARGFRLYAIRPSSLYAKIGLQNGDTVVKLNGMDLISADKALEAYTKLQGAKKVVVELERRGQPVQLTYTVKK
jgi:general secretion pathway protein C